MRNIQLLINQSRRETENSEYSEASGLSDEEFLQYMNNGQDRIQTLVASLHSNVFIAESIINLVAQTEASSIPSDALLGTRVVSVEYSDTGNTQDYVPLRQGTLSERVSSLSGTPAFYIRRGQQLLINPIPTSSSSKIRLNYVQQLPRLDIRRAKVGSVTLDTGTNTITALTLDTTVLMDVTGLSDEDVFTVVDRDGAIKMEAIRYSSIDPSSGAVTVDAGFVFETGETIAVGDYICRGKRSTSHSQLPDLLEQHLIAHCSRKVLHRDSSGDVGEADAELLALENDIKLIYGEPDSDVDYVPILTPEYLDPYMP